MTGPAQETPPPVTAGGSSRKLGRDWARIIPGTEGRLISLSAADETAWIDVRPEHVPAAEEAGQLTFGDGTAVPEASDADGLRKQLAIAVAALRDLRDGHDAGTFAHDTAHASLDEVGEVTIPAITAVRWLNGRFHDVTACRGCLATERARDAGLLP
jgi:hypothetical protein